MSTPFDEQRDAGLMRVSETPLQQPGQDRIIRRSVVAGPDISGDRRWFADAKTLGRLLEIARSSPMMRVEMSHVGVEVTLYERQDGHRYEVWKLVGCDPRPEPAPPFVTGGR
jgi:hypothetical protein